MDAKTIEIQDDRFYVINDDIYPSVTTILAGGYPNGHGLMEWYGRVGTEEAKRIKNQAADRGSIVHAAIEDLINGHTLNFNQFTEDQWRYLRAFVNFWVDYRPRTEKMEHTVYSVTHKYAGTLDWAGWITPPPKKGDEPKEVFARIDWKTSNNYYDSMGVQLVAYEKAETERGDRAADALLIIRLGSKTRKGYSVHTVTDWDAKFECFKHAAWMWEYKNPHAKPFLKEIPTTLSLNINQDENTDTEEVS